MRKTITLVATLTILFISAYAQTRLERPVVKLLYTLSDEFKTTLPTEAKWNKWQDSLVAINEADKERVEEVDKLSAKAVALNCSSGDRRFNAEPFDFEVERAKIESKAQARIREQTKVLYSLLSGAKNEQKLRSLIGDIERLYSEPKVEAPHEQR